MTWQKNKNCENFVEYLKIYIHMKVYEKLWVNIFTKLLSALVKYSKSTVLHFSHHLHFYIYFDIQKFKI